MNTPSAIPFLDGSFYAFRRNARQRNDKPLAIPIYRGNVNNNKSDFAPFACSAQSDRLPPASCFLPPYTMKPAVRDNHKKTFLVPWPVLPVPIMSRATVSGIALAYRGVLVAEEIRKQETGNRVFVRSDVNNHSE